MRTDRGAVCGAKQAFDEKSEARQAADRSRIRLGGRWSTYLCPFCDHWHVGHISGRALHNRNRRSRELVAA